jgi:hypothetical protein
MSCWNALWTGLRRGLTSCQKLIVARARLAIPAGVNSNFSYTSLAGPEAPKRLSPKDLNYF